MNKLEDASKSTIYEYSAPLLDGSLMHLSEYRGKVLLIVNTASKCGFTPQYAGLEALYLAYKDRGFEILGFPCNQFGAQEPGAAEEIVSFCQVNYGVHFAMFAKIDVNGVNEHPIYHLLKAQKRGILGTKRIKWNFTKFLVNREGKVVGRYAPASEPKTFSKKIDQLLSEPLVHI